MTERELFIAALRLPDADARAAFLEAACANKPLRERVESMLRDHEQLGSFLESPASPLAATADYRRVSDGPGAIIGPYKLLETIGEGGMGTVFMAEQTRPVKRLVALKLIKAGMDSRLVLSRFEAERQALALMDHPNIAKVLDAGATDADSPYFVMELVKGVSITKFCDEQRLTPRQRLELFLPVCQAVQHAHQKGIIHRDLKPSNVLVCLYDGQPVPKVIDFGVAKAAGPKLTEATLFTGFGAVIGTPEYMSPEQARLDNLDIDTRSDIYSLGVLLYELLTGTTPLDRKRLGQAALLEVLRVIREEEPPRPSTRLNTTEELPSIAARRNIEPRKLSGLIRGELDWVVMKALEKDRNRRYESASGLAADLRRYLCDEPMQAGPPSTWYRFRKYARRNRVGLTLASFMLLALAALGIAGVLSHRSRVTEARLLADRRALQVRLLAEKRANALERAVLAAASGNFAEAETAIGQAELLGASTGQIRMLRGQVAYHPGEIRSVTKHLEQSIRLMPDSVAARALLAQAYYNGGQTADMERLWRDLDRMVPSSPEDCLFKGQVEALIRPEAGLWLLDEAVRRRNSVIARGVRAEARANRALASGEVRDAELALEDGVAARAMLPENTFVLASSVYAQLVAADIYEVKGQSEDRRRILDQAGRDVQRLRGRTSSPIALKVCFWYFEHVGDEQAAFEMSRQGAEFRYACMLYRRGDYEGALQATDRAAARRYGLSRIESAFILAELDNGPSRALAVAKEAIDHPGDSLIARLCPPHILLLLGKQGEAFRAGVNNRRQASTTPFWYDDWYPKYLDYQSGLITEGSLLEAACGSRTKLCEALFLIGLRHLAEGDRVGARERFRQSYQTRVFFFWDYDWARCFLRRLEKDPAWPPWIPLRE